MYGGRPSKYLEHPSGMQSKVYDIPGRRVPLGRELRAPDRFGLVRETSAKGSSNDVLITQRLVFMIGRAIQSGGASLQYGPNRKNLATIGESLFTPEHTLEWLLITSSQDHSHHQRLGESAENVLAVLGSRLFTVLDGRGVTLEAIRQRAEPLAIALEGLQRIVEWEDRTRP